RRRAAGADRQDPPAGEPISRGRHRAGLIWDRHAGHRVTGPRRRPGPGRAGPRRPPRVRRSGAPAGRTPGGRPRPPARPASRRAIGIGLAGAGMVAARGEEGDVKPGERLRSRRSRAARSSPRPERAVDAALDHLGALVGVDAGWVVRSATPGLARLIGRPGATAIGRSLRQLLSPASAPATLEALARAAQAPGARVVPARLVGDRPALIVPVPTPEPSAEIYLFVSDALAEPSGAATAEVFRARLLEIE